MAVLSCCTSSLSLLTCSCKPCANVSATYNTAAAGAHALTCKHRVQTQLHGTSAACWRLHSSGPLVYKCMDDEAQERCIIGQLLAVLAVACVDMRQVASVMHPPT